MFDLLGQTWNFEVGVGTSMFNVLSPLSPRAFFCFFFLRQSSKPDFKVPTLNFEVSVQSSNLELGSWNFEPRLQCSMSPPPPTTHHLFYFFHPPRQPPTIFSIFFIFLFLEELHGRAPSLEYKS